MPKDISLPHDLVESILAYMSMENRRRHVTLADRQQLDNKNYLRSIIRERLKFCLETHTDNYVREP